jgi:hypothetical protein
LAEAYYYLGHVCRLQAGTDEMRTKYFDESRSRFREACNLAKNEASYWVGRIEGLVDELELDPTRSSNAISALNDLAQELAAIKGEAFDLLAKRAAGYARTYGGAPVSDINAVLGLPATFPKDLGPMGIDADRAVQAMPRALVWAEHYVKNADDIPISDMTAELRKLTDALVSAAASPRNQNVYLEAKVLQCCALIRLRIAEQDNKGDDRKQATEWFKAAVNKLNPKTPILWKWNEMFARQLLSLSKFKNRSKVDRLADLEEARKLAKVALDAAPASRVSAITSLQSAISIAISNAQTE